MSALAMWLLNTEMPAENSTWVTVFQHGTLGMTTMFFLKKKTEDLVLPCDVDISHHISHKYEWIYIYIVSHYIPLIYPINGISISYFISLPWSLFHVVYGDSPRCVSQVVRSNFGNSLVIFPKIFWLVVEPPLWKIWKSIGMIIP